MGFNIHSDDKRKKISGKNVINNLLKTIAQTILNGTFYRIKKVRLTHTHPPEAMPGFSTQDKRSFIVIKYLLELLGLYGTDLEENVIFISGNKLQKQTILLPHDCSVITSGFYSRLFSTPPSFVELGINYFESIKDYLNIGKDDFMELITDDNSRDWFKNP